MIELSSRIGCFSVMFIVGVLVIDVKRLAESSLRKKSAPSESRKHNSTASHQSPQLNGATAADLNGSPRMTSSQLVCFLVDYNKTRRTFSPLHPQLLITWKLTFASCPGEPSRKYCWQDKTKLSSLYIGCVIGPNGAAWTSSGCIHVQRLQTKKTKAKKASFAENREIDFAIDSRNVTGWNKINNHVCFTALTPSFSSIVISSHHKERHEFDSKAM